MEEHEPATAGDAGNVDPKTGLAERRTELANTRVELALERTTLAWIRTTLTMASFGFAVVGFFRALRRESETADSIHLHEAAVRFGFSLLILAVLSTGLCAILHKRALRRLHAGLPPEAAKWPLSLQLATLLSLAGIGLVWSLLVR